MASSSLSLYSEAIQPLSDEEKDTEDNSGYDLARFYASPLDGKGMRYVIAEFAIHKNLMHLAVVC